jgi:phosphatidylserine decarboxylase
MLDSLGSTLTKQTIDSYFTQQNLSPETDELTIEQLIQALEGEVKKRKEDKNRVRPEENDMSSGSGAVTPSLQASDAIPSLELLDGQSRPNPAIALGVDGPAARPAQDPAVAELDRPAVVGNGLPKNEVPVTDEAGIPYDDDDENEIPEESEHLERVINVKECPLCHRPRLSKRSEVDIVTHIAVCASADWNSINRILVGNYVTASQAQRKTLTKIFTKVSCAHDRL